MANAAQRRYWTDLAARGCLLCHGPAEIAHAHGGSIVERLQEPKAKGAKLSYMDWLVLPLCPSHHRHGPDALDNGVESWERKHGAQAEWLDMLCRVTGVNVWQKAREMMKLRPPNSGSGSSPAPSEPNNAAKET